jgi:hypothetical protein
MGIKITKTGRGRRVEDTKKDPKELESGEAKTRKKEVPSGTNIKTTKTGRGILTETTSGGVNRIDEATRASQRSEERVAKDPREVLADIISERMDRQIPRSKLYSMLFEDQSVTNWKGGMRGLGSNIAGGAFAASDLLTGEKVGTAASDIGQTTMGKVYKAAVGTTAAALGGYTAGMLGTAGKGAISGIGKSLPKGVRGILGVGKNRVIPFISNAKIKAAFPGATNAQIRAVSKSIGNMRVNQMATTVTQGSKRGIAGYLGKAANTKRLGTAVLLGWLGVDNISTATSFQASKVESSVIFGQMSSSQGEAQLNILQSYNKVGKASILAAAAISPLAIPLLAFGWVSTNVADNQIERSKQIVRGY